MQTLLPYCVPCMTDEATERALVPGVVQEKLVLSVTMARASKTAPWLTWALHPWLPKLPSQTAEARQQLRATMTGQVV